MKRIIVFFMALLSSTALFAVADRPVGFEELPAKAKQFVKQNFPDAKIALTTVEDENWNPSYDLVFSDGNKIEFVASGEWKEVDCKYSRVPERVIPKNIATYIRQHHPDNYVKGIERNKRKYELKLDNGLELIFDKNGKFRGYDD